MGVCGLALAWCAAWGPPLMSAAATQVHPNWVNADAEFANWADLAIWSPNWAPRWPDLPSLRRPRPDLPSLRTSQSAFKVSFQSQPGELGSIRACRELHGWLRADMHMGDPGGICIAEGGFGALRDANCRSEGSSFGRSC